MAFDWGSFWQGTGAGVVQAGTTIGTEIAEAPMKRLEMKRKGLDIKKMEEEEEDRKRRKTAEAEYTRLKKGGKIKTGRKDTGKIRYRPRTEEETRLIQDLRPEVFAS